MQNASGINTDALVQSLYAGKSKLDEKAGNAGFLGGLHVGGFGIPNQFLGLDMRTKGQKDAQEAPQAYESAMRDMLNTLEQALDTASAPYPQGS